MKYNTIGALFAFLFICHVAMAQSDGKSLTQNPNTGLYVHYDKTTYISNETIWFTAYFLDSTKTTPEILSLFVVRHADKQIVAEKKFVVADFTSKGSITLPDSLQVGDYSIITYGNYLVNDLPTYLHQQAISIKAPGRNVPSTMVVSAGFEKGRGIKFKSYPEGGKLVANVEQLIALEAIDSLSRPIQTRVLLLENGKVIDTISTNKEGFGSFKLSVQAQNIYTLKSLDSKQIGIDTLSKASDNNVVLHLPKAIVQDTLLLQLSSAHATKVNIEIGNALHTLEQLKNVELNTKKSLQIPLANMPVGLQQIRVLDENNNVLAERLFYAHYAKAQQKIIVSTDKRQYAKRDSVSLSLILPEGLDTLAQVSISVFHGTRLDRKLFQDFEASQFLTHDQLYWSEFKGAGNIEWMENMLLVGGIKKVGKFIGNESKIASINGVATMNKKPLKKSIPLTVAGEGTLEIIYTDSQGNFSFDDELLVMNDEKDVSVFATSYLAPIVDMKINDPYAIFNSQVVNYLRFPKSIPQKVINQLSEYLVDPSANLIEAVTVGARTGDIYGYVSGIIRNECGDFVCKYDMLNCELKQHNFVTRLPIKGETLLVRSAGIGVFSHYAVIKYKGCYVTGNKSMKRFPGFNLPNNFFPNDRAELERGAPLYGSTLYWSPETLLQKSKSESIGFYVGDVPGRYTIVVQGISNKGFVYAEAGFEVVE